MIEKEKQLYVRYEALRLDENETKEKKNEEEKKEKKKKNSQS